MCCRPSTSRERPESACLLRDRCDRDTFRHSRSDSLEIGCRNAAQKIVATLNSTGSPAIFLHAADAIHGDLGMVQQFFSKTFGRALPTSTIGQSATHNRMGWDHRHAVDVGLHPDSNEGRALIAYLQNSGIPFIAFRKAVTGSSTGAHIHIGRPSPSLRTVMTR